MTSLLSLRRDELCAMVGGGNWDDFQNWESRTRPLISRIFPNELDYFHELCRPKWAAPERVVTYLSDPQLSERNARAAREKKACRDKDIAANAMRNVLGFLDGLIELDQQRGSFTVGVSMIHSRVFVVHGHDSAMRYDVQQTVKALGLDPIVLHEQPNGGRTIIEKFERNADVQFAIVLLSPDDMVQLKGGGA